MPAITEALDAMKAAQAKPLPPPDVIEKAFTQGSGLVMYDLEAPAKKLYPVLTPLRNIIPRVKGQGDTATRWKAITAINTGNAHPGVTEGQRGAVIAETVTPVTAAYAGLGLENSVTFEAEYAAEGFDDAKARAVESLLRSLMMQEEKMILGGNVSLALTTTPTPTVAVVTTGGAIGAITANVGCVALTAEGYYRSSVSTAGVPTEITKNNADGTTDTIPAGAAQKSSTGTTGAMSGSTNIITASVTAVVGAVAYAWYMGTAGNEQLVAITTINSVSIGTLPANGTYQAWTAAPGSDKSRQTNFAFDGLIGIVSNLGGVNVVRLATGTNGTGTVLTADGKGGVSQIDDLLGVMWDNYRLQPNRMWVHRQELINLSKKVLNNAGTPVFRFNVDSGEAQGGILGGAVVKEYMSPIDSSVLEIKVHPNAIPGTILFTSDSLPYPTSNVGEVFRMKCRREYFQLEWPLKTRKYEYGVYCDEVLQHYAPFSMALLTNIGNG